MRAAIGLACVLATLVVADSPVADARQDAVAILRDAASHGLDPAWYPTTDDRLHDSLLRYLTDLSIGRANPRTLGYDLTPQSRVDDLPTAVQRALASGHLQDLVSAVAPQWSAYRDVQQALVTYRALAAAPGPDALPTPVRSVREGELYAGVPALHARLVAVGDLPGDSLVPTDTIVSPTLVDGLRRFQERHGLEVDGILGARTVQALQVPYSTRVRQLELALERLRWLSGYLGTDLVLVNIPMYRLSAWEAGTMGGPPAFTTRVIVGTAVRTPTPVFTSMVSDVVMRPYWNVPSSIARGELLPRARREPGYLARNNYEIVRGDGDRSPVLPLTAENLALVASGGARLRQRPGPGNALGFIKFNFPNTYSVFMHDTPGRQLFDRTERNLSHGCVRVEDPESLAEWMLRESGWFRQAIVDATQAAQSRTVVVRRPIRVVMSYATAAVDADGTVRFADDIYRHDPVLDRALRAGLPAGDDVQHGPGGGK
jgi:murein L,D-transpeptidase YcbB/YkuD